MIPVILAAVFVAGLFVLFLALLIFTEVFSVVVVTLRGLFNKLSGKEKPPV